MEETCSNKANSIICKIKDEKDSNIDKEKIYNKKDKNITHDSFGKAIKEIIFAKEWSIGQKNFILVMFADLVFIIASIIFIYIC